MTEHLSNDSTDRYLLTLETLDQANKVRNALMFNFKPKVCIYVIKNESKWDIFISNGLGSYPSDSHHDQVLKFAENIMQETQ